MMVDWRPAPQAAWCRRPPSRKLAGIVSPPPLAVSVMPLETRRETLLAVATGAERFGFDAFFLPETWAFDTLVVLAEAAVRTERVRLGTGIVSVWGRSAGTLAMAAAALADLSGGRFTLGLGASTPQLAEGLHDVPYATPLARVRRVLTQVRALLRGDRIPLVAVPAARALKLNVPPVGTLPVYLAALGDDSVRLAGELADGWMPFLYPHSRLRDGLGILAEGARRAGTPGPVLALCPSVPAVVAETAEKAREGAAWFVAFYLTTMGPLYRASLVRQGFGREVEAVLAANTPRAKGVVPAQAERLLDELTIYGTPAEARQRLGAWYAAGADMPILLLPPSLSAEDLEFSLAALSPTPADGPGRPLA